MCDFKPGDEVVCVDDAPWGGFTTAVGVSRPHGIKRGATYTVAALGVCEWDGSTNVWLKEVRNNADRGYRAARFRKVQRRDLSAWLETAATDTDHLDKPIKTPARPKVDALLKRVQSGAFG